MRKHGSDEVFRITGARQSLAEDVRGRQRRYVISMSVRTVAVIAAASLWNVERHVAIVALVLGAVLPYVAVVIANAGRETAPPMPSTFVATPVAERPMLPQGPSAAEPTAGTGAESGAGPGARPESEAEPGTRPPAEEHREPQQERQYGQG
ncbi:DUF3099 domain-containing protein [Streptomyces ficellus]|uniref:DUF3099 domain-containing protein n=1 Tax=Streptomyces ficellus TaxID=1977088 RepID=A0ABT7ZE77_9ACTN|nr:DUF3099 domain-containing protein [Streptomyces ficellus]MDN3297810.1 DUF3099 domain-containing protein [Streptomyces ficellus]